MYLLYKNLIFSGKTVYYFRQVKNKRNLNRLVEIHHIIPREFKNHPAIIYSDYNIEDGYNLILLPTDIGSEKLNIHNDRPLHFKGHINYNKYIGRCLDKMFYNKEYNECDLCKFNSYLRKQMRNISIPW